MSTQPYPTDPYGQHAAFGAPVQPPPQSRRGLAIALAVLGVVAVLVVGGTIAIVSTTFGGSTTPSPTVAAPTATGDEPVTSTSPSAPGPTCADPGSRDLVEPAGAPYTYRVPDCFEASNAVTQERQSGNAKYKTGLLPQGQTGADLIIVSVYELGLDSDTLSDSEIESQLDDLVAELSDQPADTPVNTSIAGARAWRYRVELPESTADSWFLFTGETEVQVLCQWADSDAQELIEAGCNQVLGSMTIRN